MSRTGKAPSRVVKPLLLRKRSPEIVDSAPKQAGRPGSAVLPEMSTWLPTLPRACAQI